MFGLLKKRCRENEEAPLGSVLQEPKRFHGATEKIRYIFEDADEMREEECGASEEVVSGVMRSLEEEIGVTCSTSYQGFELSSDDSAASDITSGLEIQGPECEGIDLDYLLAASDDELGIPPSPLLNLEDNSCCSSENAPAAPCYDFTPNQEFEGFGINWRFEDDLVDYSQFAAFIDGVLLLPVDLVNGGDHSVL